MAAANTDLLKKLSKRWVGQIGAGGVADASVTTIPLASTTNLATDTAVLATIDRVDANGVATPSLEETVIGVVSGSNLTTCTRAAEGTAQAHNAGAVVEILVTAKGYNDIIDHLLVGHTQLGAHNMTQIVDTNGNEEVKFTTTASAVNEVTITNAATGNAPSIAATGGDSNISLNLVSKGTGVIKFNGVAAPTSVSTDGWTTDSNSLVYVSATSFKVTGSDVTAQYTKGTKIKLTQTSAKYFVVRTSSFSTDTTVTVTGGSDYSLANAAITSPYYSYQSNPQGWPGWFNFTATVDWNGTDPTTPTTVSKFRAEGNKVEFLLKQTNTGAGANNTQVSFDGIPFNSAGAANEYNYAGMGHGSTNPSGAGLPTTNGRCVVYGSTAPTIYIFFDATIAAKACYASGFFEFAS